MQEIADRCGINKALLHYHFKSKDVLFRAVLLSGIMEVFPSILSTLNSELPLQQKLEAVVEMYIDNIGRNPELPRFVLHELGQNPNFIAEVMPGISARPTAFMAQVVEAAERGEIRPVNPMQLLADIIGLCVFPFIGKPMLQFISGMNDKAFNEFIANRKQHVKTLLVEGLFVKQH
jgi:AcrR family transcriptional regulator